MLRIKISVSLSLLHSLSLPLSLSLVGSVMCLRVFGGNDIFYLFPVLYADWSEQIDPGLPLGLTNRFWRPVFVKTITFTFIYTRKYGISLSLDRRHPFVASRIMKLM